jgi:two-component system, chemotaxis family, protein-glutamate methylesterase/glutaminase
MVIGVSAGGIDALGKILPFIPANCQIPIVIVMHIGKNSSLYFINHFQKMSNVKIKEAESDEKLAPAVVYFASPNYHLLIEHDRTFSFSVDEEVNYSRPSIDVLFESAALSFGKHLIGAILTGASVDGAKGLELIQKAGGLTMVQDPNDSFAREMPEAALKNITPDFLYTIKEFKGFMQSINQHTKPYKPDFTSDFPCKGYQ